MGVEDDPDLREVEYEALSDHRKICLDWIVRLNDGEMDGADREVEALVSELASLCVAFPEVRFPDLPEPAGDPATSFNRILAWLQRVEPVVADRLRPNLTRVDRDVARYIFLYPRQNAQEIADGMRKLFHRYRRRWELEYKELHDSQVRRAMQKLVRYGFRNEGRTYVPPTIETGRIWEKPVPGCDQPSAEERSS